MSFIPSIYKSAPQFLTAIVGANAISAVDTAYSRITQVGRHSSDGTGSVNPSSLVLTFSSSTNIQGTGQGQAFIVVEEFNRAFFRQAFQHGMVTIPAGATSVTTAHGLTLGAKANLSFRGHIGTRGSSPSTGLALTEAQALPTLRISGANIQAFVNGVPYFDGDGIVDCYYTLVDPR
jgi:hypothetical protein